MSDRDIVEETLLAQRLALIVRVARHYIDGDCSLDTFEAALDDAYGEAEDAADTIAALREALAPFALFADAAEKIVGPEAEYHVAVVEHEHQALTIGAFREAARAKGGENGL